MGPVKPKLHSWRKTRVPKRSAWSPAPTSATERGATRREISMSEGFISRGRQGNCHKGTGHGGHRAKRGGSLLSPLSSVRNAVLFSSTGGNRGNRNSFLAE